MPYREAFFQALSNYFIEKPFLDKSETDCQNNVPIEVGDDETE